MKHKFLYTALLAFSIPLLNGCKKELDVNPQERVPFDSYYKTEADAFAALVSVYDRFGFQAGGLYDKIAIMDVAGDDQLAGGGGPTDINDLQVMSTYTHNANVGPQGYIWNRSYSGIYRANVLLSVIGNIQMDAAKKARFIAETKTMRAAFYFDLVTFFKNVPLIEGIVEVKDMFNIEQTTPDKIYTYVEKDLNEAIPDLPNTVPIATEGGRLTKGAAQALLGKVLLYQEKWQPAADQFATVNGTDPGVAASVYGYKLLPNFADLWKTNNKFNSESIIEFAHSALSNGGWGDAGASEGNLLCIITGPRGYSSLKPTAPDYFSGYSFLVFTRAFFNIIRNDPRRNATAMDMDSLKAAGEANYTAGYNNTGVFLNKYIARVANRAPTTPELNFGQNVYEMRLADAFMLEAEALMRAGASVAPGSRAYKLFNAVRARVGLPEVALTQDNLELERRLELAGEGQRWLDLRRWGKAATVLASKGFVAGRHELFPIPQNELNNTKLKQNPGW
ncbi:RagB/SusD family nutrient uptake outer membrane protein [Terrimonas sp. NA20]|uniref:RagB/SusD family nutrient uptake outer membrane protein n=1 Tax=Terrimonas ginsenosidimutans TaxID=2908004 RepID=A0ABS9KWG9_9BACT|nr:RagB/SusD family nutrient uptake outer membrane protein [Terrimonas ginsenosidimutans]MCG2616707.1 RagB/SusD family nutrient uptake outer membrane protein [Terrimonas ginsenosidimutans]